MINKRVFKYAVVELLLTLTFLGIIYFFNQKNDSTSLIIGVLIFAIGFSSIIGTINSFKALKEPNSFKKVFGITINLLFFLIFVSIIIANILDLNRFLTLN